MIWMILISTQNEYQFSFSSGWSIDMGKRTMPIIICGLQQTQQITIYEEDMLILVNSALGFFSNFCSDV